MGGPRAGKLASSYWRGRCSYCLRRGRRQRHELWDATAQAHQRRQRQQRRAQGLVVLLLLLLQAAVVSVQERGQVLIAAIVLGAVVVQRWRWQRQWRQLRMVWHWLAAMVLCRRHGLLVILKGISRGRPGSL